MRINIRRIKNYLKKNYPKTFRSMKYVYKHMKGLSKERIKLLEERYVRIKPSEKAYENFVTEAKKKVRVYSASTKAKSIEKLLKNIEINAEGTHFFYSIDVYKTVYDNGALMVNSTFDYGKVINCALCDMQDQGSDDLSKEINVTILALRTYLKRCVDYVKKSDLKNKEEIIGWLLSMESGSAKSFEEALQRILFMNMVLWQTNHRLVALGRMDLYLNDLYEADIRNNRINKEKAIELIKAFYKCLHSYYWFKSDALMGDTGQIVILGGKCIDGTYFCNELTYAFIDAVEQLGKPDPKVLLRVAKNTPMELMNRAIKCISTGIGCPLLSNDELVIDGMIGFGYEAQDVYNYVTSACWEPLIPGIAHEQNNIGLINFLLPLQLLCEKEGIAQYKSFDELWKRYCVHLWGHVHFICGLLNGIIWEKDPLISTYTDSCRVSRKDISEGGGKYNNYGILTVAMSNAVNALLTLKHKVYEEGIIDLKDLEFMRNNDYKGHEDIRKFLLMQKYYGHDNDEAIFWTKEIMRVTEEALSGYRNIFNGRAKIGLSSPGYIQAAEGFPASFDGRRTGEPFSVHISGDDSVAYTELMRFAAQLDYTSTKFNGNVVDFFVTPTMLSENIGLFAKFVYDSMMMGVFQMQLNVVSSEKLIAARKNPEMYTDLVVRVWGFSAYFVQLPDEYKDYLIERALKSEGLMS